MLFTWNLQRRQKHEFDLLGAPIFVRVWVLRKCKNDCLLDDGADDRGAHAYHCVGRFPFSGSAQQETITKSIGVSSHGSRNIKLLCIR